MKIELEVIIIYGNIIKDGIIYVLLFIDWDIDIWDI